MESKTSFLYNSSGLAKKDLFDIARIKVIPPEFDIQYYYAALASSFAQKVIEGLTGFSYLTHQNFNGIVLTEYYFNAETYSRVVQRSAFKDETRFKKSDLSISTGDLDVGKRVKSLIDLLKDIEQRNFSAVREFEVDSDRIIFQYGDDVVAFDYYDMPQNKRVLHFRFFHPKQKLSVVKISY